MPKTTEILALAFVVLFAALFMPVAIEATTTDKTSGYQIEEGNQLTPTNGLTVTADEINTSTSPDEATFTVRDVQSQERITETIPVNNQSSFNMSGGNVTVSVDAITDGPVATIMVQHPRTYGWSEPAKAFGEHLHIILGVVTIVMIAGVIGRMI